MNVEAIQQEQINALVDAIILQGKRVNLVGLANEEDARSKNELQFVQALTDTGAHIVYNCEDEYPRFDTTVVVKPCGQWRHYDSVTLFMIPEHVHWGLIRC